MTMRRRVAIRKAVVEQGICNNGFSSIDAVFGLHIFLVDVVAPHYCFSGGSGGGIALSWSSYVKDDDVGSITAGDGQVPSFFSEIVSLWTIHHHHSRLYLHDGIVSRG